MENNVARPIAAVAIALAIALAIGAAIGYFVPHLITDEQPLENLTTTSVGTDTKSDLTRSSEDNLLVTVPTEKTEGTNEWNIPGYTFAFLALVQAGNPVDESLIFANAAKQDPSLLKNGELIKFTRSLGSDGLINLPESSKFLEDSRAHSRDAKRVSDIKQVLTALEIFYADNSFYPSQTNLELGVDVSCLSGTNGFGEACVSDGTTYMGRVPSNPSPGGTPYIYNGDGRNYTITFSLEKTTGSLTPGPHTATPNGIK